MSKSRAFLGALDDILRKSLGAVKKDVQKVKGFAKKLTSETVETLSSEQVDDVIREAAKVSDASIERTIQMEVGDDIKSAVDDTVRIVQDSFKKNGSFTDKTKNRLGTWFTPDEIESIQTLGDDLFTNKKLNRELSNKMKVQEYNKKAVSLEGELRTLLKDDFDRIKPMIDNISGTSADVAKERAKVLWKMRAVAKKKVIAGGMEKKGAIGKIIGLKSTLSDKMDDLFEIANKLNFKSAKDSIDNFANYIDGAEGINHKSKNLLTEMYGEASRFDADTQLKIAKAYDEMVDNVDDIVLVGDGNTTYKSIKGSKAILEKYGLGGEHQSFINRMKNTMRAIKKTEYDMSNGVFNNKHLQFESFSRVPDDIVSNTVERYHTKFLADIGPNYRPLIPTDEHRVAIEAAKKIDPLSSDYNFTKYNSYSERGRLDSSQLAADYSKQLGLADSIKEYIKFPNQMIKKYGDNLLDKVEADFSVLGVSKGDKNIGKFFEGLDDMRRHWNDIHAFPDKMPEGAIANVANTITYLNKVFALSAPRMAMFNALQPITNNVTKNPIQVLKSQLGAGGILFDLCFSKGNMKKAIARNAAREKDPLFRAVKERYFREHYPNVQSALLDMEQPLIGKLKQLSNYVTMMYQTSDTYTRMVNLDACNETFMRAFKRHKGMQLKDPAQFVNLMSKELQIKQLGLRKREKIMKALLKKDMDDAMFQYAKEVTELELYNYGKYGRPELLDKAKKNPIVANAVTFISWPLYYTNVMKTVSRAAAQGNYKPAAYQAALAVGWVGAMSKLSDSSDEEIAQYGKYGLYRTPVIQPLLGLAKLPERSVSGILGPTIDALTYPAVKSTQLLSDQFSENKNIFDYYAQDAEERLERMPASARPTAIYEFYKVMSDIMKGNID
jgi:hypothetical protein